MKKVLSSLLFRLVLAVIIGIVVGLAASAPVIQVVLTVRYILGQLILFCVPLIVLGFITPSITKLGMGATRMLGVALALAYISSVGAALFSMAAGYAIIPGLTIANTAQGLQTLPEMVFELNIPAVMPVMSALVLSVIIGLATVWTKAEKTAALLQEIHGIVLAIVKRVMIPLLPFFIAATFATLAYEGVITRQLPVFIAIVLIVMVGHFLWLALLYTVAGIYARVNPWRVLKHYGPAYLTAVGTMSSAATLGVALDSAGKSDVLRKDMVDFGIPLFANIHLCGSVLTEVFFVMAVSLLLYGSIPPVGTMVLFCLLLGIFAVGAPGVPGGTVMASLGLITGILGFSEAGTALMLTVFALQDSFGTACNITGDGALTLILSTYASKREKKRPGRPVAKSR